MELAVYERRVGLCRNRPVPCMVSHRLSFSASWGKTARRYGGTPLTRIASLAATALVLVMSACDTSTPGLPPPGTPGGASARLFYPIAVGVDPCGQTLYIANSNFDRAYTDGTLVSIPTSMFNAPDGGSDGGPFLQPFPTTAGSYSIGLLDTFASNMIVSGTCTGGQDENARLYVTTRNNGTLSSAFIAADGGFECFGAGSGTQNCSGDAIAVSAPPLNFQDPFALQLASTTIDGGVANVVLVSHLSQAATSTDGIGLDTSMAVIPEPPHTPPTSGPWGSAAYAVDLGQPGSNSIAIGPNNQVLVGGCFLLVPGGTQVPCLNDTNNLTYYHSNPLRFFFLDSGPSPLVVTLGMGSLLGTAGTGGGQIDDVAISTDKTLTYTAVETPNVLLVTAIPETNYVPAVESLIPLTYTPQRMLVLPRAGQGDLIVIASTQSNALTIVDPTRGTIVAQIAPIGNQPFGMAAIPTPTGYRVFVALFNDCGVAAVDIPTNTPELSAVTAIVGTSCVESSQQMVLFEGLL
jgi:hypothetical protein